MKTLDISGVRFGLLVAIAFAYRRNGDRIWLCQCDCGNTAYVSLSNLRTGNSTRCRGCGYQSSQRKNFRHGMVDRPEYRSWAAMLSRCTNPNDSGYKNYGARGIAVCDAWHTFTQFFRDMGEKPFRGATLERINNDDNYTPENCMWASRIVQANNKRANHLITYNGLTQSLALWARGYGLTQSCLRQRLVVGYSFEEAIQRRVYRKHAYSCRTHLVTLHGETKSLTEWIQALGLNRGTVKSRLRRGYSDVDALTKPLQVHRSR